MRVVDDTLNADVAYRLACEGTGLLWRGDYHQARQMLQALGRRLDRSAQATQASQARKQANSVLQKTELTVQSNQALSANFVSNLTPMAAQEVSQAFHLHRQAQGHRARVLGMVLLPFGVDHRIDLRRAPDVRQACAEGWGPATADTPPSVASLRELLALVSAHEWHKKGVEIPALGQPPHNRIHPRYGVFSPVRGEYVDLVATAPLPAPAEQLLAFDIGTGTGVLSAVLARRGVARVVATDLDERALACARANLQRLGLQASPGEPHTQGQVVELVQADLFPPGRAQLVVCNPPWLPARASSPIEHAVYDEGSRMLRGFLNGLADHLAPGGEGWLIMSDLAERLGLRAPTELTDWVTAAGLRVVGQLNARPLHPKARDTSDPLHAARAAEVTSLWRLAALAG